MTWLFCRNVGTLVIIIKVLGMTRSIEAYGLIAYALNSTSHVLIMLYLGNLRL